MDYEIDRSESQDTQTVKCPRWFLDAMRAFVIRNSIKITQPDFIAYLTLTWDAHKDWLRQEIIGAVLSRIVAENKIFTLPTDSHWLSVKPKDKTPDTDLLAAISSWLDIQINQNGIGIKPELTEREQAGLRICGGWQGLLDYARSYSIPSAIRFFKEQLANADDWGFQKTIALPANNEKVQKIADLTKLIGQKL